MHSLSFSSAFLRTDAFCFHPNFGGNKRVKIKVNSKLNNNRLILTDRLILLMTRNSTLQHLIILVQMDSFPPFIVAVSCHLSVLGVFLSKLSQNFCAQELHFSLTL